MNYSFNQDCQDNNKIFRELQNVIDKFSSLEKLKQGLLPCRILLSELKGETAGI